MKFVAVAEKVCGDDLSCGINTVCVRPEYFDSPLFCLHENFLNHDFQLPSACNLSSAPVDIVTSSYSVYHGFVIFFMFAISGLLSVILYLIFTGHRKYLPSVYYADNSVCRIPGIVNPFPETVPTLPALVQNIQEVVRVLPPAAAIAPNVDVVAP